MARRLSLLLIAVFMLILLAPSPDSHDAWTQLWRGQATKRAGQAQSDAHYFATSQAQRTAIWARATARSHAIWSRATTTAATRQAKYGAERATMYARATADIAAIRAHGAAERAVIYATATAQAQARIPTATPVPPPGTWVFLGEDRIQIEVLAHTRRGDLLFVTVRLHNPLSKPVFPDTGIINLRADGAVFSQSSPRHRCGRFPGNVRAVIYERFLDPQMPGGETVTGDLCWKQIPAAQRLELVPREFSWTGTPIRVL